MDIQRDDKFSNRTRYLLTEASLTLQTDVLSDLVGDHTVETLVHGHFPPDFGPGGLVQLVHGGRDCSGLVAGYSGELEDTVQDLSVVQL